MAKATKLPSGSWRCVAYLGTDKNGRQIRKSFTAASKKDAEALARACELTEKKSVQLIEDRDMTIANALDRYINKKTVEVEKKKLSPSTLRGYKSLRKNSYDDLLDIPILRITDTTINEWLDTLEEEHTGKTCKNAYSLLRSALIEVLPRHVVIDWRIELPATPKAKVNVPLERDIQTLLQYFRTNDYDLYISCLLAAFGTLRRSEICALTADDIDRDNCVVHINKALILDPDNKWILKDTKTELSTRDVVLPAFVINALPEAGDVISVDPNRISDRFASTLRRMNMHFRFHDLRHYSASIMHELGASNESIMRRGGWSNDYTLNKHYRGVMNEYDAIITEKVNNHFSEKFAI